MQRWKSNSYVIQDRKMMQYFQPQILGAELYNTYINLYSKLLIIFTLNFMHILFRNILMFYKADKTQTDLL